MPRKTKLDRWPLGPGRPTLGPYVVAWCESNLVHGEGNAAGKPFRFHPWGADLVHRAYELNPDGTRKYDRVLVGVGSGNAKSEYCAAVSCAELCGPVVFTGWDKDGAPLPGGLRTSPDIPVCANSFEQAALVFNAARAMLKGGPLAEHVEVYETEVLLKGAPGRLYRVPAVAANVDGVRPTFVAVDELHEFAGARERVFNVLEAKRAKRGAWGLWITTAGWDPGSLLGRLYAHGKRVQSGEVTDPGLLFLWYEASDKHDLADPAQLEAAIREANPAAGSFLSVANIVRQHGKVPDSDFFRYHLNRWAAAPKQWISADDWNPAARPERVVSPDEPVVLAFDGSYNRDSTALVLCTMSEPRHLQLVGLWERPYQAPADWRVPREDVLAAIAGALTRYNVKVFAYDDVFAASWGVDFEALAEKGTVQLVKWETRSQARMGPAAAAFYGALKDGRLTHDGSPELAAHVAHAVAKGSRFGLLPTKDSPDSPRKIDALIAGIVAYDMACRGEPESSGPWLVAVIPHNV